MSYLYLTDFLNLKEISSDLQQELQTCIQVKEVKKGEIIISKGDLKHKKFYVRNGLLRSYIIDSKGREHIYMFAPEGWVVSDLVSLTGNQPAIMFVDALEDSTLEVIDDERIWKLKDRFPELMTSESDRMLRRIAVLQQRVIMLLSASAQERYEAFLTKYPDLIQRIPQKMIASYLGVTPEALSKIRANMSKS
ncbi:MAG TPA: Crp/Fnr family transcriptional regulator [Flavobacteriales bacterium]|nr:Crp/Fnr family transcriptional regulator [Flavobacteriales bacterium]